MEAMKATSTKMSKIYVQTESCNNKWEGHKLSSSQCSQLSLKYTSRKIRWR